MKNVEQSEKILFDQIIDKKQTVYQGGNVGFILLFKCIEKNTGK